MKYLKEELLKNRKGEIVQVPDKNGISLQELTVGAFVYLAMEAYIPIQGSIVLSPAQMRYFNHVLDKLDREPKEDGRWEFEDSEFAVIKLIFEKIAPLVPILARHTPTFEDALAKTEDK